MAPYKILLKLQATRHGMKCVQKSLCGVKCKASEGCCRDSTAIAEKLHPCEKHAPIKYT